jgi:hypothetical protein
MLRRNDQVLLVIALKPDALTVRPPSITPNVIGQQFEQAVRIIKDAGLTVGERSSQETGDAVPGTVLRQNPPAGREVRPGSAVKLLIASRKAAQSIHKRGRLDIPQTYTADLDEGRVSERNDADIFFEAETETERYLTPINGATVALVRNQGLPDRGDCSSARFAEKRINVDILQRRDAAVCVRTNRGRFAAFKLLEPVTPGSGVLKIGYNCYE